MSLLLITHSDEKRLSHKEERALSLFAENCSRAMDLDNLYQSSLSSAAQRKKRRAYSEIEIVSLLNQCDDAIKSLAGTSARHTQKEEDAHIISQAEELCSRAHLSTEPELTRELKSIKSTSANDTLNNKVPTTTGGHSNIDHQVTWTGDYDTDKISELSRQLISRARYQSVETILPENRWDKKKIPGERRRRLVRDSGAPPLPPPSGYVLFLGQMTTKWRHDRSSEEHRQSRVIAEVSKLWKHALTDEERNYYNNFAEEIRAEYKQQLLEYRATGAFTPSELFERQEGVGLWVHKKVSEKTELELEISQYETLNFPPRPPEYDEDYHRRFKESIERRKSKLKKDREEMYKKLENQGIKVRRRMRRKNIKDDSHESNEI